MNKDSVIKHIVCSGGGIAGFSYYGMLKECYNQGLWKIEDIETIYGTSVGSICAVVISLKYDWIILDDYLIKRPWQNVFKFDLYSIINSVEKRGIFGLETIKEILKPLLNGKNLSTDITLKEFYEHTKIEIHVFSTEITSFELVDFSYKTHPNWKLIDVVYTSCSVPIIFSPLIKDSKCYCDGGLLLNYPLSKCIENGADKDEIIGLYCSINENNDIISEKSSLLDYIIIILKKLICVFLPKTSNSIKHEYTIESPIVSIYDIVSITNSIDERTSLIEKGVDVIKNIFTSTKEN